MSILFSASCAGSPQPTLPENGETEQGFPLPLPLLPVAGEGEIILFRMSSWAGAKHHIPPTHEIWVPISRPTIHWTPDIRQVFGAVVDSDVTPDDGITLMRILDAIFVFAEQGKFVSIDV